MFSRKKYVTRNRCETEMFQSDYCLTFVSKRGSCQCLQLWCQKDNIIPAQIQGCQLCLTFKMLQKGVIIIFFGTEFGNLLSFLKVSTCPKLTTLLKMHKVSNNNAENWNGSQMCHLSFYGKLLLDRLSNNFRIYLLH